MGFTGADVWRGDWEERWWREGEHEEAGAMAQGVSWRVGMEMGRQTPESQGGKGQ